MIGFTAMRLTSMNHLNAIGKDGKSGTVNVVASLKKEKSMKALLNVRSWDCTEGKGDLVNEEICNLSWLCVFI